MRRCASNWKSSIHVLDLQTDGITEILQAPGKLAEKIKGMSGTRNLSDNLSDLKAQVWISHPFVDLPCWMPQRISLLAVVSARKLYACVDNTSQQLTDSSLRCRWLQTTRALGWCKT